METISIGAVVDTINLIVLKLRQTRDLPADVTSLSGQIERVALILSAVEKHGLSEKTTTSPIFQVLKKQVDRCNELASELTNKNIIVKFFQSGSLLERVKDAALRLSQTLDQLSTAVGMDQYVELRADLEAVCCGLRNLRLDVLTEFREELQKLRVDLLGLQRRDATCKEQQLSRVQTAVRSALWHSGLDVPEGPEAWKQAAVTLHSEVISKTEAKEKTEAQFLEKIFGLLQCAPVATPPAVAVAAWTDQLSAEMCCPLTNECIQLENKRLVSTDPQVKHMIDDCHSCLGQGAPPPAQQNLPGPPAHSPGASKPSFGQELVIRQAITGEEEELLAAATQAESVEKIREMLRRRMNPNVTDKHGATALHSVVSVDAAKLLIDASADLEARDERSRTPLLAAAETGRTVVLQLLLDMNADPYARLSTVRKTVLHMASTAGMVAPLLNKGVPVDARDMNERTPLHEATYRGLVDVVTELIKYKASVHDKDKEGDTALHIASRVGKVDVMRILLKYGALPNAINKGGLTALHVASSGDAADILLDCKADIHAGSPLDWRTPLHQASISNRASVVERLLCRGANVKAKDTGGMTAQDLAHTKGFSEVIRVFHAFRHRKERELLQACGAHAEDLPKIEALLRVVNPKIKQQDGSTPLHLASQAGHEQVVQRLLRHCEPVDPIAKNNAGKTPLHLATSAAVASVLLTAVVLKQGASCCDIVDEDGRTPLHEASLYGRLPVVKELLAQGANPLAIDRKRRTPKDLAKAEKDNCKADKKLKESYNAVAAELTKAEKLTNSHQKALTPKGIFKNTMFKR